MCTVSSDGKIHIYDLASVPEGPSSTPIEIHPVAEYDSKGTRLTCVTLAEADVEDGVAPINGKRKRSEDGASDEDAGGSEDEGEDADNAWEDEEEEENEDEDEGEEE